MTAGWKWRDCCLFCRTEDLKPYGFCSACWDKHGRPVPVSVKDRVDNPEP
jgi:hypothetical protein